MSDIVKGFFTIKENVQAEIVEKKSKFIANLFYIENIEEAEKIVKETTALAAAPLSRLEKPAP